MAQGSTLAYDKKRTKAHYSPAFDQFYAAIDLGSNTCRLLIMGAPPGNRILEIVETFSRIVRLGEGLSANDALSDLAMDRTLAVLKMCAEKLQSYKPIHLRCVATEACRRAKNGTTFLERVAAETGLFFDIINYEQEIHLALLGCSAFIDRQKNYTLLFDIGGGSTEILWAVNDLGGGVPRGIDWISLPYGVVNVAEFHDTNKAHNYQYVVSLIQEELDDFCTRNGIDDHIAAGKVQLLGTSGTATTTAALYLGLSRYERHKIEGVILPFNDLRRTIQHLQMMSSSDRLYQLSLGAGRTDLMMGGLAILEGICDTFSTGYLSVADRGVREGIITDLWRKSLTPGFKNTYCLSDLDRPIS